MISRDYYARERGLILWTLRQINAVPTKRRLLKATNLREQTLDFVIAQLCDEGLIQKCTPVSRRRSGAKVYHESVYYPTLRGLEVESS